jgi:NADH:ubiquinone oxidoreductase subunit 5 (subunit L)/multisubunit Na+/H+ antiporter MnhA subunit
MFDMGGLKLRMPITFMCMLIGALATIGIPPLSGFWSEEAIYSATWELAQEAGRLGQSALLFSAYGLFFFLMVTVAVTTFYIVRMMGMVFNRESKHVEKLEDQRELINEVSPMMWVPMVILASATIVIGVFAPFIITSFHEFFSPPPLYQSMAYNEVMDILRRVFLSPSSGITYAALAIGGYPAYQLYITRQADPVKLINEHCFLRRVHGFLWKRCYIDALYRKVADGTRTFSNIAYKRLEFNVDALNYTVASFFRKSAKLAYTHLELSIDALNYFLANQYVSFCQRFRKIQTGVLSYNVLMVSIGAALLIVLLFLFGRR